MPPNLSVLFVGFLIWPRIAAAVNDQSKKKIKKIMATENLPCKEALVFKKNNFYTFAFKLFEAVNNNF